MTKKFNELIEVVTISDSQAVKEDYTPIDDLVERFIEVAHSLVKN